MAKRGRPPKTFTEKDINQMKVLARCHCPDSEIAAYLECGERTLQRKFGAVLTECREAGKANVRAKQYELAMKGNVALLIWLGKQILGQKENPLIEINPPGQREISADTIKEFRELLQEFRSLNEPIDRTPSAGPGLLAKAEDAIDCVSPNEGGGE